MPDVNMPGGETFVRQMQYGKGYYRDKLGVDVTAGWLIDTFGHHAQMPQLLKLGGLQVVLVLARGAEAGPPVGVPLGGDRRHEDPRLLAAVQLRPACTARPRSCRRSPTSSRKRFAMLTPNSHGAATASAWRGSTSASPRSTWRRWSRRSTRSPTRPFEIRLAVPSEFEAVVAEARGSARVQGGAEPDLPGDVQQPDRAETLDADLERRCSRPRSSARSADWLGAPADPRRPLAGLGARAVQRDTRPRLGRHDRPRLRRHGQ